MNPVYHLQNDASRAKAQATKRANRIKALGTTEERMQAPLLDRAVRRPTLMGLFREGKTLEEVVALHPREDYNTVWSCWNMVRLEVRNALDELL